MRTLVSFALVAFLAFGAIPSAASDMNGGEDCAYRLEPVAVNGNTIETEPVLIGCFDTYAEAIVAGSSGQIEASADLTPLTLGESSVEAGSSDVLIGTEWTGLSYAGTSNSYFASSTCNASHTWDLSYVTDNWNDVFSSGKGFGGCDRNRKFQHSNFGGASILCTPNCSNYGSLSNEVSSLRWSD